MPPTLEQKRAFWAKCRERTLAGFKFFCESVLKIRTFKRLPGQSRKQVQWVPLILNEAQERVAQTILDDLAAGKSAMVIVLKCRKLGISTLVQALGYWLGCFEAGWETQVVAHEAQATATIARISRGFAEHLPPFAVERLAASNAGAGLKWSNGSRLQVFTQKSDDAARGSSPSLLHLSEVAFWGRGRRKTTEEDALVSLMAALEEGSDDEDDDSWMDGEEDERDKTNIENILDDAMKRIAKKGSGGTITVIESTANGAQGAFFNRWIAAHADGSLWTPLFFAWQKSKKYQFREADEIDAFANAKIQVALRHGDRKTAQDTFAELGFDELWCQRGVKYELTVSQVRFALRVLAKFGGDLSKFDQEFPLAPELAFAASGRRVWGDEEVDRHTERTPVFTSGLLGPLSSAKDMTARQRLEAARTPGDAIRIWAWPDESTTDRYAIGCDVSAGIGGDYTTAVVLDRVQMQQVAEFYSNTTSPDNAARQIARLAECYGNANICYEANNHGNVLGHTLLFACKYTNIYRRTLVDEPDENSWIREFGWATNERTRTMMTERLIGLVRQVAVRVVSPRLLSEMRTWVFDENGRPDHVPGKHDDLLIGLGLSLYASDQMPDPEKKTGKASQRDMWRDSTITEDPFKQWA